MQHKTVTTALGQLAIAMAALAACVNAPAEDGRGRLALDVAPLTLPGVTGAVYDVVVEYDDGGGWSPVLTLDDRDGEASGALTYVAPCVGGVDNRVTVTLVAVLGPGGAPLTDVALPPAAQKTVACVANADRPVTFDITVARAAQQGFLDVSFDLEDVFCSAKYDCVDALVHDPVTGDRGPTLVTGLSCTAGLDEASALTLAGATLCCTDADGDSACFAEGDALIAALAAAHRFAGAALVANGSYIDLSWRLADAWLAANPGGACRFQAVGWVDVGAAAPYVEGWPLVHWDVAITRDAPDDITCAGGSAVSFAYSRRALCEDATTSTPGVIVTNTDVCAAGDDDVGATCGASAAEHVVAFTAPTAGSFRFTAHGDGFAPVLYARDACVGAELACAADAGSDPSIWVDLEAGETAWIFVAHPDVGCISAAATLDVVETVCGDGSLDLAAGEACDDGNTTDGDGCSATCALEAGIGSTNLSQAPLFPASGRTCGDAVAYSVIGLSATTATVTPTPTGDCLTAGDEVLLLNAQGTAGHVDNIGVYELLTVADVTGDVVTFTTAKTRFYGDASGGDANIGTGAADQKVVLQRVPSYPSVTIPSGATVTVDGWNGLTGGVLALRAASLDVAGALSVNQVGYRPGRWSQDNSDCDDTVATGRGETIDGPATVTTATSWGAPGGLAARYNVNFNASTFVNSSPGHATPGAYGRSAESRTPAAAGGTYGVGDGTRLTFGSADSGAFSCWTGSGPQLRDTSGAAGGILLALVTGDLTVEVGGAIGSDGYLVTGTARWGADAGGYVLLEAESVTIAGAVTARGGTNRNTHGATNSAPAGDGYVVLRYRDSVSGATDPPANTIDLTP